MTYHEYWDDEPKIATNIMKAYKLKKERMNEEEWLQGMYIYDALVRVSGLFRFKFKGTLKAEPYLEKPYPITEETQEQRRLEEEKAKMERMKMQFMEFASHVKPRTKSADEHRAVTEDSNYADNDRRYTDPDSK